MYKTDNLTDKMDNIDNMDNLWTNNIHKIVHIRVKHISHPCVALQYVEDQPFAFFAVSTLPESQ